MLALLAAMLVAILYVSGPGRLVSLLFEPAQVDVFANPAPAVAALPPSATRPDEADAQAARAAGEPELATSPPVSPPASLATSLPADNVPPDNVPPDGASSLQEATVAAADSRTTVETNAAGPSTSPRPAGAAEAAAAEAVIPQSRPAGVDDLTLLVRFPFDSVDIGLESRVILDEAARILRRDPRSTARINGYADSLGEPSYNEYLSLRRAQAVEQYLLQAGVAASQLTAQGRGALTEEVRPADGRPISDTEPPRIVQIIISRAPSSGPPSSEGRAQL